MTLGGRGSATSRVPDATLRARRAGVPSRSDGHGAWRDLRELRDRERARPEVLRRVRDAARWPAARPAAPPTRPAPSSAASAARPWPAGRATGAGAGTVRRRRRRPQPSPAPVAERRLVSVLFADLVGFTPFAEERDAEETRELLTRYFDLARDVIEPLRRHGREVHRRRGHGRLGRADRPRGRRRAGRPGRRSSWSTRSRGLGPGIEARAGVLTGEAAVTIGATNQGMVAGDLVNTASRLQSVGAARAPSWSARRPSARRARRSPSRRPASRTLKGKASPGPRLARAARRRRARRPRTGARRSRRRSSAATTSCGCSRTCSTRPAASGGPGSCRSSARPGSARAASPGSSSSTSTAWSRRSAGTTAARPAYGEGITFWALGEMVREPLPGSLETDDEATTRAKVARDGRGVRPRRGGAALDRAGAARLLGRASAPAGRLGDELFGAWRTFFERIAARRHGRPGVRGPPLGRHRPARLHRPPARVVARACRSTSSRWPGRSCSSGGPTGAPASATSRASASSRCPTPAMRELLAGLVPGPAGGGVRAHRRPRRRHPAVRRRDRPDAGRRGPPARGGRRLRPVGDLDQPRRAGDAPRSSRRASTPSSRPTGRSLQDAAVLGQSFTVGRRSARVSGVDQADARAAPPGARPPRAAHPRDRPAQPGARPVRVRPGAHPRGRLQHAGPARPQEPPPRRRPLLRGARRPTSSPARWRPLPRRPRNAPEGPEADALAGQARIALKGAAERAAALGSNDQALGFLRQALEVTTDEAEAGILERAGRRRERRQARLRRVSCWRTRSPGTGPTTISGRSPGPRPSSAWSSSTSPNRTPPRKVMEGVAAETARDRRRPRRRPPADRAVACPTPISGDPRALATADRALELGERLELVPSIAEALVNRALALGFGSRRYYETVALLRGALVLAEANGLGSTFLRATNNLAATLENDDPREAMALSENGIEYARRIGNRRLARIHGQRDDLHRRVHRRMGEGRPHDRRVRGARSGGPGQGPPRSRQGHAPRLSGSDRCRRGTPRRARGRSTRASTIPGSRVGACRPGRSSTGWPVASRRRIAEAIASRAAR